MIRLLILLIGDENVLIEKIRCIFNIQLLALNCFSLVIKMVNQLYILKTSSNLWWNPKHCSLAVLCTFHSVHHPIHEPRISSFHYQTEIKKFKQVVRKKTEIKAYICNKRLPPDSTLYKATDTGHEHNWNSKSSSNRLSTKTPTIKLPHLAKTLIVF